MSFPQGDMLALDERKLLFLVFIIDTTLVPSYKKNATDL
jgi:hypothetical protein